MFHNNFYPSEYSIPMRELSIPMRELSIPDKSSKLIIE